jgi:hypothetical protein
LARNAWYELTSLKTLVSVTELFGYTVRSVQPVTPTNRSAAAATVAVRMV